VTFYSPGQAAAKTGFSLDTLRYYEKIGLLEPISRTAGGRRRFTETDVRWLLLLRCLRETGMPITQMLRFVELTRAGQHTITDRVTLLEEHDQHIDEQIARLRACQQQIQGKIGCYRSLHQTGRLPDERCPDRRLFRRREVHDRRRACPPRPGIHRC
jgi:DNA-binding transcriptional MerR regulator